MKKNSFLILFALISIVSCDDDHKNNPQIVTDLNNQNVTSLAIDNTNALWAGTDSGLYKKVNSGYQQIDIKSDAGVTALGYEKPNNILWVGTTEGLIKVTLAGNKTSSVAIPVENMSYDSVSSVYVTQDSERWFGTGYGVTRNLLELWQKEKFKKNLSGTISAAAFEKVGINSIASWDGDFYFASNGRSVYRAYGWNSTISAFTGATQLLKPYNGTNLSDTAFVVFVDSQSRQWMGGREGLVMHIGHDPKAENTSFYSELVNPRVHCIAEAPDGKIWAGTEKGISIYDGTNWTPLTANLPNNYVTAIAFESNGKTWIGTKAGIISLD